MEQLLTPALNAASVYAQFTDALTLLGVAYLALLANLLVACIAYAYGRASLVVSPNQAARDYGLYGTVTLVVLLIAIVLDHELRPEYPPVLPYAAMPHVLLVGLLHAAVHRRPEPWLVTLAAASMLGAVLVLLAASSLGGGIRPAHGLAALLMSGLIVFLAIKSISTKRGFMQATSIYTSSKEQPARTLGPQTPWLGLGQWVALAVASLVVAALNELLRGQDPADIGALRVASQAMLLLASTTLICAVPALSYWLARRTWMPELTRFAWLVWLVVGFARTYGNYLGSPWRV